MGKNRNWDKNKNTFIYIIFEKNKPYKIKYVGKTTSDIKTRINHHLWETKKKVKRNIPTTYKEKWLISINFNIDYKIIDSEEDWSKAEKLEIYYIKKFKTEGHKLTNLTDGGDGATAKYKSDNNNAKRTLQYDLEGNFIKEYMSRIDAEIETGIKNALISGCCTRERIKTAGGFIWKNYTSNYPLKIDGISINEEFQKNKFALKFGKKVQQYDLNGIFIKEYISLREMERQTGYKRPTVKYGIENNTKPYGFRWKIKTI